MPDLRSIPVSNARHAGSGVMSLLLAEQLGQDPLRLPSPAPASSGPNADPVEQSAASRRATQNILWQEWQQQQGQQQGSGQEQQVQGVVQQPGRQRSASATWLQAEGSRSSQQEWEGAGSQPGRRDGGGEQAGPEGQQQAGQHIQATGPSQQLRPWGLEPHQAGVEGSQGGSLLAASFDSFIVTQPSMQHQQQRQAEQQSVGRQQQGQWQMDQQHSGWASQAGAKQPVPTKHQPPQQHPPHLQQHPAALQQQRPKAETSWPEGYPQQGQMQPLAQPGQHRSATATPSSPHHQAARGLLPEPHHTMVHQAWGPAALPAAVRTQQAAPLHAPQGVAVAAAPTAAWQMQEQPEGPLGRLQSMAPDLEITLARAPTAGVSALAAREGEGERRAGLGGRGAGGQGGEVSSAAAHHGSQEAAGGGGDEGGGASSGEDSLAESGDESGDEAEAGRQALLSFLLLKASRARQRRQLRAVLHGWQRAAQAARLDGLLLQTVVRLRAEHVMRGVLKHWQCLVASLTAPEAPSTTLPTASSHHPGQHFLHTRATPAQPTVTITSTIATGSSETGDGSSSNGRRSSSSSSKRGRSKCGSGDTGVPDAAATHHPSQSQSWSAGSSTSPPPPQPILLAGHSAASSASSLAVTSQSESQVSSSSRELASRPGHEPRPVAWDPAKAEHWQHEGAGGSKHRGGPRGRCSEEQDQGEQQGEEEDEDMGQALSGPSCAAQPGRLPLRSAVPAAEPCASPTRHQRQPLHSFPGSDSHAAARASHADAVLLASPAPQASAPPSELQELHSLVSRMEALLWQQSRQEQGSGGPGQQRAGFMQRKEVQGWQDQGRLPDPPTSSAAAMQARIARLMRLSPALQPQLEQLMDDAPDTAALSQPHQWQQQQQLPQGGATTGTQAKAPTLPKQRPHPTNAPPTAQPHNAAPRQAPGQQHAKLQRHLRLVRPSRPADPPSSMTHGGSGRASPPPPSPPSPPLPQGSKVGGGREPSAAGRQAHQARGANALQPAVHTVAGYGAAQAWETGDMHQHLCPEDHSQRPYDDGGGGEYGAGRLAAYGHGLGDEAAASRSGTLLPGRLQRLVNMQALRRQQHKPGKALAAATMPGEQVLDPVWSSAEQDQQLHAEAAKPAQTHGYAEAVSHELHHYSCPSIRSLSSFPGSTKNKWAGDIKGRSSVACHRNSLCACCIESPARANSSQLRLRLRALKSSPARKQAAVAQPATSVATAGAASTAALQQLADMRQHVRQLEAQVREAMVDLTPGHSGPAAAAVNVRPPIRTPAQAQALTLEGVPSSSRRNHLANTNHNSRHADLLASEYPRTQQDSAARALPGNEPDRQSGPLGAARPGRAVSAPRTRLGVKPAGAATTGSSKLGPAGDVHVGIRSDTHSWRVKDQEKQLRGAGGEASSAAVARQQAVPATGQSTAARLLQGAEGKAAQAAMAAWAAGASITGTASAAPWTSKVPVQTKMDKGCCCCWALGGLSRSRLQPSSGYSLPLAGSFPCYGHQHSSSWRHLLSPMHCMFNAALQSLSSHLSGFALYWVGSAASSTLVRLLRLAGEGVLGPGSEAAGCVAAWLLHGGCGGLWGAITGHHIRPRTGWSRCWLQAGRSKRCSTCPAEGFQPARLVGCSWSSSSSHGCWPFTAELTRVVRCSSTGTTLPRSWSVPLGLHTTLQQARSTAAAPHPPPVPMLAAPKNTTSCLARPWRSMDTSAMSSFNCSHAHKAHTCAVAMYLMYYENANGERVYTMAVSSGVRGWKLSGYLRASIGSRWLQKVDPDGNPTKSAHPARFSPDDKFSRERITLKKRFNLLPTQQPPYEM
ncbi:hypothetical protein QJQ45_030243 [Haematococcus lacustris]|nr:hypothetical protein QJQ45_030243 [Haematococcus lacustris]